jgi:hypothetical protein
MKIKITKTERNNILKERIKANLLQGKVIDSMEMTSNLIANVDENNPYKDLKSTDVDKLMDELITEGFAEAVLKK